MPIIKLKPSVFSLSLLCVVLIFFIAILWIDKSTVEACLYSLEFKLVHSQAIWVLGNPFPEVPFTDFVPRSHYKQVNPKELGIVPWVDIFKVTEADVYILRGVYTREKALEEGVLLYLFNGYNGCHWLVFKQKFS